MPANSDGVVYSKTINDINIHNIKDNLIQINKKIELITQLTIFKEINQTILTDDIKKSFKIIVTNHMKSCNQCNIKKCKIFDQLKCIHKELQINLKEAEIYNDFICHQKNGKKINKNIIICLLNEDIYTKKTYETLVLEAYEQEKITKDQMIASKICKITTIKKYLYTCVQNKKMREIIDKYVINYSKIFFAGTLVINAFLLYCHKHDMINDNLINNIQDQTVMKYMLLPMKSQISGISKECPCNEFNCFWNQYHIELESLYPSISDLTFINWDQSLNEMVKTLKNNFVLHVTKHFIKRFTSYIFLNLKTQFYIKAKKINIDNIDRSFFYDKSTVFLVSDIYHLINKGTYIIKDGIEVPTEIVSFITEERNKIGMLKQEINEDEFDFNDTQYIKNSIDCALFKKFIDIAIFLKQNNHLSYDQTNKSKPFSVFPIANIGRHFSYVDERILKQLLKHYNNNCEKEHRLNENMKIDDFLELNNGSWKEKRKIIRQNMRKKNNISKRKKNNGMGAVIQNGTIKSFLTDGVSICLYFYIISANESNEIIYDDNNDKKIQYEDAHIIGFDNGRVILSKSSQEVNKKNVSTELTSKRYQEKSLIKQHTEWFASYQEQNIDLQKAQDDLSTGSWKSVYLCDFLKMCQLYLKNITVFNKYYINDKSHALWKMRLFRKKTSIIMNYFASTLKLGINKNKITVIAMGNAKYSSTGIKGMEKNHGGVPTTKQKKMIIKTLKSFNLPFLFMDIDEYNTSKCCHKCGHKLKDVYDSNNGYSLRGLKQCVHCKTEECDEKKEIKCSAEKEYPYRFKKYCSLCSKKLSVDEIDKYWQYSTLSEDKTKSGIRLCDLKLCTNCICKTTIKLCNRDGNSAQNMRLCATNKLKGLDRPEFLRRPSKQTTKQLPFKININQFQLKMIYFIGLQQTFARLNTL